MKSQEVVEFIKKHKWYRQATNSKAYYIVRPCKGAARCIETKMAFCTISKTKYFEGFYIEDEFDKKANAIVEKQKTDISHIDAILGRARECMQKMELFFDKCSKEDIKNADFEKIKNLLTELDSLNYDFWVDAFVCDVFDPNGEKILEREIKNSGIKLEDSELATLLRPEKLHYAQKERLELLRMALSIKEGKYDDEKVKELLRKHAEEYYYLDNSWESTKILDADDFKDKLNEMINDNSIEDITAQIEELTKDWKDEHNQLIEKYQIRDELLNIIYLFRQLFFFRDERKGYVLLSNHFYDQLFSRLSELVGIDLDELATLMISDLDIGLDAEGYRKIINERKEILMTVAGADQFFSGQEAKKIYKELHSSFGHEGETIEGSIASKGKVRGYAMIVMGEAHFGKFDKGHILVAPMTRPEYVPLMKKASAIITDEGGLTCHAAIVARELGKPCIVGTRVATKVLKDGDMIEVDAEKGIIKRIG